MKFNWIFIFMVCFALGISSLQASLSPGPLHRAHSQLEGLKNCMSCHEIGRQVSQTKCLACHQLIRDSLSAKTGLHGHENYQNCTECHKDHFGKDASIVKWEPNRDEFDHSKTGYALVGAHADLDCRQCHTPQNIQDSDSLIKQKKSLNRTFLGLTSTCLSCHDDQHKGQLSSKCLTCHSMTTWKPVRNFNHDTKTKYPLTGAHQKVSCAQCHKKKSGIIRYKPLKHNDCLDCHTSPHQASLGDTCTQCHSTQTWRVTRGFNHDVTDFPLIGKHADIGCNMCHTSPTKVALKHQQCTDCHDDFHNGRFSEAPYFNDCRMCHNENGFSPSSFTLKDHQIRSNYPLNGAHLAVACQLCHGDEMSDPFTLSHQTCQDCHTDPHLSQFSQWPDVKTCQMCHSENSWTILHFDHDRDTNFPLKEGHENVSCQECHFIEKNILEDVSFVRYRPLGNRCEDCHKF